jgi:hypothetical protein
MRAVRLARLAAEAERLRLTAMVSRQLRRLVLLVIGLFFLIATIIVAHVAGFMALRLYLVPLSATLALAAADLLLALIFLLTGLSGGISRRERMALATRDQAIAGLGEAISASALRAAMIRIVLAQFRR